MKRISLLAFMLCIQVPVFSGNVQANVTEDLNRAGIELLNQDLYSLNGKWLDGDESVYVIEGNRGYKISNRDYDRNEITVFVITRDKEGKIRITYEPESFRTIYANDRVPEKVALQIVKQKIKPYAIVKFVNPNIVSGMYYSWEATWDYKEKLLSIVPGQIKSVLTLKRQKIPYSYRGGGIFRHYSGDYNEDPAKLFPRSPSTFFPKSFLR